MLHALRRLAVSLSLAVLLVLAACGGGTPAAAPTEAPEPTAEAAAPTRTPRPTREPAPTEEAEPTEEPTEEAEPTEEPTAVSLGGDSDTGELQQVEIGDLQTYAHDSGVFQLDVPENWTLQDSSTPDELILLWTDPTRNGGIIVDIYEDENAYAEEDLINTLNSYLENRFGSQPDFSAGEPTTQSDDSVLIVWTYTATADNDVQAELLGNSFIEQRGNKVSILTTLVPSDQFDALQEQTNGIINTYRIDPEATIGSGGGSGGDGGTALSSGGSGEAPSTVAAVGDAVEVGNLTMTVTGVEEPEGSEFLKPEDGNKFVIVRVKFDNNGSQEEVVSTLLQMSLIDGAGTTYDLDLIAATVAEQTPDGSVPAGGSLEGGVGFQVPTSASGLVFVFKPLLGGDAVGVALD